MESTSPVWALIALSRKAPKPIDPVHEVRLLLRTATLCDPAAGPFLLQGKSHLRFDPNQERALRAAIAHAQPTQLNARAGVPCRLFGVSEKGPSFVLAWPSRPGALAASAPGADDPRVSVQIRWPFQKEDSAAREIDALLAVVKAFAEAFEPRIVEVCPAEPNEATLRGAWLVAQPETGSPTLSETWHLARPAPPIAGLPSYTAHLGSPFSFSPADTEARRILLSAARMLRDAPPRPTAQAEVEPAPEIREPLAPTFSEKAPRAASRFSSTIALDKLAEERGSLPLPFRAEGASDESALKNAMSHAEATQGPKAPGSRSSSGGTVDVGALVAHPTPFGSPTTQAASQPTSAPKSSASSGSTVDVGTLLANPTPFALPTKQGASHLASAPAAQPPAASTPPATLSASHPASAPAVQPPAASTIAATNPSVAAPPATASTSPPLTPSDSAAGAPSRRAFASTVAVDNSNSPSEALPFREAPKGPPPPSAAAPPRVAVPELTVEQYASLCVEIALSPDRLDYTLYRYHITAEQRAALDTHWRARFAAEPALRAAFAQAFAAYRNMLTSRQGG